MVSFRQKKNPPPPQQAVDVKKQNRIIGNGDQSRETFPLKAKIVRIVYVVC